MLLLFRGELAAIAYGEDQLPKSDVHVGGVTLHEPLPRGKRIAAHCRKGKRQPAAESPLSV
jgi:hypothetical protein